MSQNYPELCGVETKLRQLIDQFNMAQREGTLLARADALAAIQVEAREAEYTINNIMFGNK